MGCNTYTTSVAQFGTTHHFSWKQWNDDDDVVDDDLVPCIGFRVVDQFDLSLVFLLDLFVIQYYPFS